MIFSFPKKVIRMLMNYKNQIQTMNMFWMTNKIPRMPLLFRSSLILTKFLKHLFCFTLFVKAYSRIFCFYRFNITSFTENKAFYFFRYYKTLIFFSKFLVLENKSTTENILCFCRRFGTCCSIIKT